MLEKAKLALKTAMILKLIRKVLSDSGKKAIFQ